MWSAETANKVLEEVGSALRVEAGAPIAPSFLTEVLKGVLKGKLLHQMEKEGLEAGILLLAEESARMRAQIRGFAQSGPVDGGVTLEKDGECSGCGKSWKVVMVTPQAVEGNVMLVGFICPACGTTNRAT